MSPTLLPDSGKQSRITAIERLVFGALYLLIIFPIILFVGGIILLVLALITIVWGLVFGEDVPKSYRVTNCARRLVVNISDNLEWIVTGKKGFYPIPYVNLQIVARN